MSASNTEKQYVRHVYDSRATSLVMNAYLSVRRKFDERRRSPHSGISSGETFAEAIRKGATPSILMTVEELNIIVRLLEEETQDRVLVALWRILRDTCKEQQLHPALSVDRDGTTSVMLIYHP